MSKRAKGWFFIWVSLLFPAIAISTLAFGALGDPDRSDWPIWTGVIVLLSAAVVVAYIWVFRSMRALRAPDRSGRQATGRTARVSIVSSQQPKGATQRLAAPWRPLLGNRYAVEIARRKLSFAVAISAQLAIWALVWALGLMHIGPTWIFPVLIIGSGAVTVATIVRFGRFGARVRRDLAAHGVHVRELLVARRPDDVQQWAGRNHVDLHVVAQIGDHRR